jgi:hypothetical protein
MPNHAMSRAALGAVFGRPQVTAKKTGGLAERFILEVRPLRWDLDDDELNWLRHVKTHEIAGGVAVAALVWAAWLFWKHSARHRRLP